MTYGSGVNSYSRYGSADKYRSASKKRKGSNKRTVAVIVLVVLVLAIVATAIYALVSINRISNQLKPDVETQVSLDGLLSETSFDEPFYILLLGTDGGKGRSSERSDTIVLCRVDTSVPQITLVSMMRDLAIDDYGDYGTVKLNSTFFYDGVAGVVKTVQELAGVDISYYVKVSFTGLTEIIDTIGGVDVDVQVSFSLTDNETGKLVKLEAGEQTLDGTQALAYCRERHSYVNQDFGRTAAQRQVITAMLEKITKMPLTSYPSLIEDLGDAVETNLEMGDILKLAKLVRGIDSDHIYSAYTPAGEEYIDGISYLRLYQSQWDTLIGRVKEGLPPYEEEETDETVVITEDDIKPLS